MQSILPSAVAVVCATKDRPEKLRCLLHNLSELSSLPKQIIIADGGRNLSAVVKDFESKLPTMHLGCPEVGQVLQRQFAHKHLEPNIRLVLHLDDDITLDPDSLDKALKNWNKITEKGKKPLAGMAFNVVNIPLRKNNILRNLALMRLEPRGCVWASGYVSPHVPSLGMQGENPSTEWLIGGAALWTREAIEKPHPLSFPTRWAVFEDVIFSFPFSKTHSLVVCADAVAHHNDSYQNHGYRQAFFYGRSRVTMQNFLVSSNRELSLLAFIWTSSIHACGLLLAGALGKKGGVWTAFGMLTALAQVLLSKLTQKSHEDLARQLVD